MTRKRLYSRRAGGLAVYSHLFRNARFARLTRRLHLSSLARRETFAQKQTPMVIVRVAPHRSSRSSGMFAAEYSKTSSSSYSGSISVGRSGYFASSALRVREPSLLLVVELAVTVEWQQHGIHHVKNAVTAMTCSSIFAALEAVHHVFVLFIVVIVVIVVVVVIVVYACFRVEDQKWHLSLERVLEV